jgi:hypothetical protein
VRRRTVLAADLEPLYLPAALRRDLGQQYRGKHGDGQPTGVSRMALSLDQAPVLDAANPHGFAAGAVLAAMADLYPAGSDH